MILVPLLAGGFLWLRDSSLVAVQKVRIVGVSGPGAAGIRTALTQAAREMTTLHVRDDALLAAVRSYPTVRALRTDASLPHDLRITVALRPAVAVLEGAGQRTAVAADGTLLRGMPAPPGVPALPVPGDGAARARAIAPALRAAAAAAPAMRAHLSRIFDGPHGLQADLRGGPEVILGDARRARAKWVATARVLGDPAAHSARYIDVRLPERAVAGGLSTSTSSGTGSTSG